MEIYERVPSPAETLLTVSKGIKKGRLLNLGGQKEENDWTKFLANVLKVASFGLERRNLLCNTKGEICTSFLVKTINSFLKLLPDQIAKISLVGLKNAFGIGKMISAVIDAGMNLGKVTEDKTKTEAFIQIMYEIIKMGIRSYCSSIIFGNLQNTKLQGLIGPIIYLLVNCLYTPWDSLTPEMDFVRDAAEEIFDGMKKK